MKKLLKNFGFTLVEVLMAAGITSAVVLILINSFKENNSQVVQYQQTLELNNLIQRVTTELSKKEVCEKNFKGSSLPIAPTAPANIPSLVTRNGAHLLSVGSIYGEQNPQTAIQIISMNKQGTTSANVSRLTKMNIVVGFRIVKKTTSSASSPFESVDQDSFFNIPVNVFLSRDSSTVDTCYSDVQSLLENAVKRACIDDESATFNGLRTATYFPPDATYPYGHCEHVAEIRNNANGIVTQCPPGELLQNITTTSGKMTFQCRPFSTTTTCPAWSYLQGVNPDGSANCVDIRTLFPNSGFMVLKGGVFSVQNISCPTNEVLQRIDAAGLPVCVNPRNNYTCPVNQYVTAINADGSVSCSYSSNRNACAGNSFMTAIDSVGNVTCGSPALLGSCTAPNVIVGINAAGQVICGINQP